MTKYTLGIDLGTYNSAAAVLGPQGMVAPVSASPDRQLWARTGESIKPFPSVVTYTPEGKVRAVGLDAKKLAEQEPQFSIWGVKRLLGKTYHEALAHGELDRMLLPVEPDARNGRCVFEIGDREIQPEDVCAELLRFIRRTAEKEFKAVFPEVVLSVPAYFDAIHISAVKDAADRAGFGHVETIPEPVAAALAFNIPVTPRPLNFLVFDIGAGTLDVTAAEVWRSKPGAAGISCRCLKNTGDTHLGGLDMDDRLVEYVSTAMEVSPGDEDRLRLRRAVEGAKVSLSTNATAAIETPIDGSARRYELTRMELEEALRGEPRDLIEACRDQVTDAIREAGWTPEKVEHLLLIGGPIAMPCLRKVLEEIHRRNPAVLAQLKQFDGAGEGAVDRMLAVAIGAAKSRDTSLTKIHPYGYGFVRVRLEPVANQPVYRVHREPAILVPRDSVFPSEPVTVMPENPFYRVDHIFSIELIQHVPESEGGALGAGKHEFRFLGEQQLSFARIPYAMQVSMRLNENGELETTLRNALGSESVTRVGVGSLVRNPIELPTTGTMPKDPCSVKELTFVPEKAEGVRKCLAGLCSFVSAKTRAKPTQDPYLLESLQTGQYLLGRWGGSPKDDVMQAHNAALEVLGRALELKYLDQNEYGRLHDELSAARSACWVAKD